MLTMRGPAEARRGAFLNDPGLIPDGSVLIRDGLVEEVGPTRRVENLKAARDAVEISAAGRVVMPGFVDSHTHLAFPPPGWAHTDGVPALNTVKRSSAKSIANQMRRYLRAMARHGTTTVEVKSGCGGVALTCKLTVLLKESPESTSACALANPRRSARFAIANSKNINRRMSISSSSVVNSSLAGRRPHAHQ